MDELVFRQLVCSIKYSYHVSFSLPLPLNFFFFQTAAFYCGGHTLVQKSDIDRAPTSPRQPQAGERYRWIKRRVSPAQDRQ